MQESFSARIAQFHEVTQPNFVIWIEPDGSILYDTRQVTTFPLPSAKK